MIKCVHCGQELPESHLAGQEDEKQRLMALFTLRLRFKAWLREGETLLQVIDSLIPADNQKPLSPEQMQKDLLGLIGNDHAKKVSQKS